MARSIAFAAVLSGLALALIHPALAQNGRPPPPTSTSTRPPPIKLEQPTSTATQAPIKIGKPAPTPTPTPKPVGAEGLKGVDINKMIDAALKMPMQPSVYQWEAGQGTVQLQPAATHLCVLTGVSGNFRGAGERVELNMDMAAAGGPRYVLRGSSGQGQLRAHAVCVRKDRFTPAITADNSRIMHSAQPLMIHFGCSTARKAFTKLGPDYGYFVREFGGKFDGLGDFVRTSGNSLYVSACAGYAAGSASAIHMIESGPVKYLGPTGRTTDDRVARFYATLDNPAPGKANITPVSLATPDRMLVPVSQALCGLAEVGGRFNGYGEAAEIVMTTFNGELYWKAQISNGLAGSGVTMAVRCIARDQR